MGLRRIRPFHDSSQSFRQSQSGPIRRDWSLHTWMVPAIFRTPSNRLCMWMVNRDLTGPTTVKPDPMLCREVRTPGVAKNGTRPLISSMNRAIKAGLSAHPINSRPRITAESATPGWGERTLHPHTLERLCSAVDPQWRRSFFCRRLPKAGRTVIFHGLFKSVPWLTIR